MSYCLQAGEPALKKTVTAELGCVTPYIIVPGNWSQQALEYYADECVAGLINNAGHNCTKLELLITAKDWPQRSQFIAAVRWDKHPLCRGSLKEHISLREGVEAA